MIGWELPVQAVFGGKTYKIHGDYRDILEIFSYFEDPDLPAYLKWKIALALFYEEPVPEKYHPEAMAFLSDFLKGGHQEDAKPGVRLLDWQQDAAVIVADINKVAGREIRAVPFIHWWTFLAWFHAIGEGQLSTLVSVRQKIRQGKPLEEWEKTYYRENRQQVDLKPRYSREELRQQAEIKKLLGEE